MIMGVIDGLVQRGGVGAADDDRIDAAVDQLAHLLDLVESLRFDWVMTTSLTSPSFFHLGISTVCRRSITSARQVLPA